MNNKGEPTNGPLKIFSMVSCNKIVPLSLEQLKVGQASLYNLFPLSGVCA